MRENELLTAMVVQLPKHQFSGSFALDASPDEPCLPRYIGDIQYVQFSDTSYVMKSTHSLSSPHSE